MKIAIIPAAGSATRFKELGKQYAKTVLPYKGIPIIVHIVRQLQEAIQPDLIRVVYSNEEHKKQIQESLSLYNLSVEFVAVGKGRQGPARSILSGIPATVTNRDSIYVHLSDFVASQPEVLKMPEDRIAVFHVDDPSRWCMAETQERMVISKFIDKPKTEVNTNLAVAGLYSFSDAKLFRDCGMAVSNDKQGEFNISEIMEEYMKVIPLRTFPLSQSSLIDFGTIEEYIQNRGISKARNFNIVTDLGHSVEKSSSENPEKVIAEATWMTIAPYSMERYSPRVYEIDHQQGKMRMEKVKSTNLRDLYLYLDRSEQTWTEVFTSVQGFMVSCRDIRTRGNSFWEMIIAKTIDRASKNTDAQSFITKLSSAIRKSRFYNEKTYYHGDLHFANMFYCFTYKDLKLIDPRGEFQGHWFYDLAKLNHSVNGKYDWIDSQLYSDTGIYDRGTEGVKAAFKKLVDSFQLMEEELVLLDMLTASLFLSMIPLHSHSRKNQELYLEQFWRLSGETEK